MTTTATRLAAMLDHGHPLAEEAQQAAAELRRLDAEVQALRKDAARYRWLLGCYLSFDLCGEARKHGNLDAAIDAAMKGAANG